ncbi:MAG: serine hydrolase, partial [Spirochaetales bacterium]|nr:serine hydrolase [Spirochaetales bacterium]
QALDLYYLKMSNQKTLSGMLYIKQGSNILYKNSLGSMDSKEKADFNENTYFQIGSITKMFTAYLCLIAEEQGYIDLDEAVVKYLPETKLPIDLKVKNLLSNTSGIKDCSLTFWYIRHKGKDFNKENYIKWARDKKLKYSPGMGWNYSNPGFALIGIILEKQTGEDAASLYKKWIFTPLGMNNSGFGENPDDTNKAKGTTSFLGIKWHPKKTDYAMSYTSGNIYSTASDMDLWLEELYSGKLLSKKQKEKMFFPYFMCYENTAYGYGCYVEKRKINSEEHKIISHSGGVTGFSTMVSVDLETGLKTIIFLNIRHLDNVYLQEALEADTFKLIQQSLPPDRF